MALEDIQASVDAIVAKKKIRMTAELIKALNQATSKVMNVELFKLDGSIRSNAAKQVIEGLLIGTGEAGLPALVDTYLENETIGQVQDKMEKLVRELTIEVVENPDA